MGTRALRISGLSKLTVSALAAAANTFLVELDTGAALRLYQNDFVPNAFSGLTDFVEADFTGYEEFAFTSTFKEHRNSLEEWFIYNQLVSVFRAGALTSPQTVYGWFITNGGVAAVLAAWGRFDVPFTFNLNLDLQTFCPEIVFPASTGYVPG